MVEFEVRSVRRSPPAHDTGNTANSGAAALGADARTPQHRYDAHAIVSCPRCYGVFTLTHGGASRVLFGSCEYCDVEGIANLQ